MSKAPFNHFMNSHYGKIDYIVWMKDTFDTSWQIWSKEATSSTAWEPIPLDNTADVFLDSYQQLAFCFNDLTVCEIRILIHSPRKLDAPSREHLESTIREALLREQLSIERIQHERWLDGLRELTGALDLNELLFKIMENALKVIPSVHCGLFMMMDPATNKMVPRAQVGFKDSIYDYYGDVDEGITGKVYRDGQGRIYTTPEAALKDTSNVSPLNLDLVRGSFQSDSVSIGMMAVPVTMNTDKIGVMLVYQLENNKRLNEYDLSQLQGFANQAAIAISNARMYAELIEANAYLVNRDEVHNRFTQLSIENVTLGHMLETVATMLELPAYFIDFAKNDWYPHMPSSALFTDIDLDQALGYPMSPKTLTDHSSGASYYMYPIQNASLLVGCFVIELRRPLVQLDYVILEQGGAVVMLQMMNTYSMTEMVYRRSRDFFDDLVQYREPVNLASRLQRFGLTAHMPLFVSLLQLADDNQDLKAREAYMRKLIALIEKELLPASYLLFGSHDKVTILASAASVRAKNQLLHKLKTAASKWITAGFPPLYGGIGGLFSGLEHVAKSNEEAARSLAFLLRRQRAGITQYEEIGINRLFLNQEPQEIELYITEILQPLRSHKHQAAELEQTLRTFMAENRSVAATAERLHIHTNTLYVRLRKIEELLQLNLSDSEDWMKVYLACHLSESY